MYCEFFGLRCRPFEDRADTRFFFATPDAEEIEANAEAAAEYRESVDRAYGNAAAEMDSIAAQIAGEEPATAPSGAARD